jgi:predicted RecA/RadA family phage recombinase
MGDLKLNGATSGTITVTPTAIAGTNTITLPASTGTVALTANTTFTGTITFPGSGVWNSSGNVGIGTTSPARKLGIEESGTNYQMRIGDAGGNYYDIGRDTGNGLLTFYGSQTAASGYVFSTVNGERARINTSGNFLVGTASTFDITSGATTQLSGQCAVYNSGGSSPNTLMSFYNATQSARVGYIGSSGNSTSYNSGSDYRLKENVANINGALSTVSAMRPVTFTWKISPEAGVVSGFIAHELQEIFPEAVGGQKDAMCDDGITPNYQMVDQSKLVPLLVAAIQELSAKNDALEARLAALEAK